MKSYGARVDEDGIPQAAVSDAVDYGRPLVLYERRVGAGKIVCELVRPSRNARRIVRLTAKYQDGDTDVTSVCNVTDELDEKATLQRLEKRILEAQIRPVGQADETTK
jgi:hypothetical protein